jgi:hypothetical protein
MKPKGKEVEEGESSHLGPKSPPTKKQKPLKPDRAGKKHLKPIADDEGQECQSGGS